MLRVDLVGEVATQKELTPKCLKLMRSNKPDAQIKWLEEMLVGLNSGAEWHLVLCYSCLTSAENWITEIVRLAVQAGLTYDIWEWDAHHLKTANNSLDIRTKKIIYAGFDFNSAATLPEPADDVYVNDFVRRLYLTHLRHVLYLRPAIYGFTLPMIRNPDLLRANELIMLQEMELSIMTRMPLLYGEKCISVFCQNKVTNINNLFVTASPMTLAKLYDRVMKQLNYDMAALGLSTPNYNVILTPSEYLTKVSPMPDEVFVSYAYLNNCPQLLISTLPKPASDKYQFMTTMPMDAPVVKVYSNDPAGVIVNARMSRFFLDLAFLNWASMAGLLRLTKNVAYVSSPGIDVATMIAKLFPTLIFVVFGGDEKLDKDNLHVVTEPFIPKGDKPYLAMGIKATTELQAALKLLPLGAQLLVTPKTTEVISGEINSAPFVDPIEPIYSVHARCTDPDKGLKFEPLDTTNLAVATRFMAAVTRQVKLTLPMLMARLQTKDNIVPLIQGRFDYDLWLALHLLIQHDRIKCTEHWKHIHSMAL